MFGKKIEGFTLVELMVVVAIVGILAAIAVPSYERYVLQAKRSAAQSYLSQIALKEEEYFAHMRAYTGTIGSGGLGLSDPGETSGRYTYSVCTATGSCSSLSNFPANGFIVIATRVAGSAQMRDTVGDLVLYSTGKKCTVTGVDTKWGAQTC